MLSDHSHGIFGYYQLWLLQGCLYVTMFMCSVLDSGDEPCISCCGGQLSVVLPFSAFELVCWLVDFIGLCP